MIMINDLKERVESFVKKDVFNFSGRLNYSEIIYDFGKYLIVNINRAKGNELFIGYNNDRLRRKHLNIINSMLKMAYELGLEYNDRYELDDFKLWIYENTNKNHARV